MSRNIKITGMMESSRVKILQLENNIRLDEQRHCPACETRLDVACILIGKSSGQEIDYGLCSGCGYMGYIQRPTKEWMANFYSFNWDKMHRRGPEEIKNSTILPGKHVKLGRFLAASMIDKFNLDKNKTICEIGSGYGEVLKFFKERGYHNLVGVENSKHRAELVSSVFGVNILHGEFENNNVQEELKKKRPFGLFFSYHVLEHTYHPAEIIAKAASLQKVGDYLILALPNAEGEHLNYALLYLAHLHSFSRYSLEFLLNRFGYELIADNSPDNSNLIVGAQKVYNPKRFTGAKTRTDYFNEFNSRFDRALAVEAVSKSNIGELYWEQNKTKDYSRFKPYATDVLHKIIWPIKSRIAKFKTRLLEKFSSGHTMLVQGWRSNFYTKTREIRFDDKIKFLVK